MCMINPHRQSLIGTRVSAFYRLLAIVLAGLPATSAAAADQPNPPPQPVLHLANGRNVGRSDPGFDPAGSSALAGRVV